MFVRRSFYITLAALFLLPLSAAASQAANDADAKELKSYTLTTAALQQFVTATRNMMAAAKADPRFGEVMKLEAEIEKLGEKEEPTEADDARMEKLSEQLDALKEKLPRVNMADSNLKTLTDIENAIKREPLMANALKSAGMSPRDYAKFTLAFFQAAMIQGMQKSGLVKEIPKDLQASVNMENIKFIEANQAEITKLMAEFQAASKQ
jgi:hypothetical protein